MQPKLKILIVEDNPRISRELSMMISELGYEPCAIANSYDEALNSFKQQLPDLALCDIKIHGYKDGIQAARDMLKIKPIPIVYLTAFFEEEIENRALETEPAGYLLKPINFQQLEIALKLALKQHKNGVQLPSIPKEDVFYVCVKGVYELIRLEDILYLEADNVGTNIVTLQKKYEIPSKTLKKMLEELIHPCIVRASRSEAVNIKKIKQFDKGISYLLLDQSHISLKDKIKQVIYVSESYRAEVKKILGV